MTHEEIIDQFLVELNKVRPARLSEPDLFLKITGKTYQEDDLNYQRVLLRMKNESLTGNADGSAVQITNKGHKIVESGGYLKYLANRKAKEEFAETSAQLDQELKRKQLKHLKLYKAVSIVSVAVAIISMLITWSAVSDDKKIETLENHIKQVDSAIKNLKGEKIK